MTTEADSRNQQMIDETFPFQLITATHAHADARTQVIERTDYEVCTVEYVVRGKGVLTVNGETYHPEKDGIYFLPKGSTHSYAPDRNDPWHKYFFVVDGSLMTSLFKAYGLDGVCHFPGCPQMKHYFEEMIALNPNSDNVNRRGALLFHQFLNDLAGSYYGMPSRLPPEAEKLKATLDSSMTSGFNLAEYARSSDFSEAHLIRVFRNIFGMPPYDYLMSRKIELAKRLLLYSSFSIKEIAAHLAFSDQYYFSNYFKMKTGLSPRNYKQKYIGKRKTT